MAKLVSRQIISNYKEFKKVAYADKNIEKAFSIIARATRMTPNTQHELQEICLFISFRGFNSHFGDCYIYNSGINFYISFGMSNIKQAGRGIEKRIIMKREIK